MRRLLLAATLVAPLSAVAKPHQDVFRAPDLLKPGAVVETAAAFPSEAPSSPAPQSPKVSPQAPLDRPRVDAPPSGSAPADTPLPKVSAAPMTEAPPLDVPPLDPASTGAPHLTTAFDVAADRARTAAQLRAHEARHRGVAAVRVAPPVAAQASPAVPVTVSATPVQPDGQAAQPGVGTGAGGCAGGIEQLLSPSCLGSMKAAAGEPPAPAPAPQQTQCALVMFNAAGTPSTPATFQTAGVEQCLAMASRLSYGIPGTSNITAMDPLMGMVAVACRRPAPDGREIACEAQR